MSTIGIRIKQLLLIAGDYAIFIAALVLTLLLRYGSLDLGNWNAHILPFSILGIPWIISLYVFGLYDLSVARDSFSFFRAYLEGMFSNLAIAFGFFYLIPIFGIAPRTNLLLYFATALLLGYAWRIGFNRFISPSLFRNRVLFIGPAGDATDLSKLLLSSNAGFDLVAAIDPSGSTGKDEQISWKTDIANIETIITDQRITAIVLGLKPETVPGLNEALYRTLFSSVSLFARADLEESLTGRVALEYVNETWFLENLREHEKAWYESVKRVGDIILAIPVGGIMLMLLPLTALLVKLSSPGPIFIRQTRVGKYGKNFTLFKYRTMISNAPDGSAEAGGAPQLTQRNDPRITKIGGFLRKMRLDELPQVWNVLRGDLSFIGPRPERPEFVADLTRQISFYPLRHLTRPGLTGWSQVSYGYASTQEQNLNKLRYDLFYIKNRSPLLDAAILLKTIGIVLRRQGM